jgi:CelD/BcsL family acetyltransferase involved in cellulose biosynthesis
MMTRPILDVPRPQAAAVARVIMDVKEWESMEGEWRQLFAASPTASPPLSWEWLREWWRLYGPVCEDAGQGLRIFTVRQGARLIGALPLYLSRRDRRSFGSRRLRFLSTGESEDEETAAEYLDLLHLPGTAPACMSAIQAALVGSAAMPWDELDLSPIAQRSPLVEGLSAAKGGRQRVVISQQPECYVADLTGGFEAYLKRLSPRNRATARQLLRAVEAGKLDFELAGDAVSTDQCFNDLVMLHQERWSAAGQPGCFASSRFTEFHRTLHRLWVPDGRAVLARLSHDGRPLAVVSGFIVGEKLHHYLVGTGRADLKLIRSPGIAAHLLLKIHLAERGITQYDYLGGRYEYKQCFSTRQESLVRLRVLRPSVRTLACLTAESARATGGRVVRRLRTAATRAESG